MESMNLDDAHVAVSGTASSGGIAMGPVRIVRELSEAYKIQPGDVVVCHMAMHDWEPHLKRAAGVVADSGGLLSIHSIIARNLGIPCVAGTKVGTELLKDGQHVIVDGDQGVVLISHHTSGELSPGIATTHQARAASGSGQIARLMLLPIFFVVGLLLVDIPLRITFVFWRTLSSIAVSLASLGIIGFLLALPVLLLYAAVVVVTTPSFTIAVLMSWAELRWRLTASTPIDAAIRCFFWPHLCTFLLLPRLLGVEVSSEGLWIYRLRDRHTGQTISMMPKMLGVFRSS